MRKMPKVDEYDPVVYPRKLWVTDEVEGLDRIFKFMRVNNFNLENQDSYHNLLDEKDHGTGVLVTCPVVNKISGDYGILIIILNLPLVVAGDSAHEAVHAADYIFQVTGSYAQDFTESNEPYAYLVGWIAGCIDKTLIKAKKRYDDRRESDDVED